ncbi:MULTISPECIES: hypothetical protein [unclassified Roseofilum]|uniref:hypothetical protein n=1 Tax=unclassified Roseofilum TaxID=2620099 RepID=UPI000E84F8B4|nr:MULTISPECIES: hypothetical protein [unclassified Roseofilum]MBP0009471.1 hypothetical protein [Roseofilum sp. Belize Diploria]MBP0033938.1 hypothetical protein [Roseofilum sp. Belize BBD 4]HBQ97073.1 hypothetical protein [Cyanobacteria bacterium UBA11691]
MSKLVERINLTAHAQLEKSLGYTGDRRWVAWHWDSDIGQLMYSDGDDVGAGQAIAWQVFLQHPEVDPIVEPYHLEQEENWLLLDRTSRQFYVGEGQAIQSLLDNPESLRLLAQLDGNTNSIQDTADTVKQTFNQWSQSDAGRLLKTVLPVGVGIVLIAGLGFAAWTWLKPRLQEQLSQTVTRTTFAPGYSCGIGGTGDFSGYVAHEVGDNAPHRWRDRELHLISIYEAHWDHSGGYHPTRQVDIQVERRDRPIILALSAYEPVQWHLRTAPGVKIEKIIINGYYDQAIVGAEGIPVEEYSYHQTGNMLGMIHYNWGEASATANSQSLVAQLQSQTQIPLTSFQGCYRGTSFELK